MSERPTTEPTGVAASLDARVAAACGHLNACYAALADLVAEGMEPDAWNVTGIQTVEQWITWRTGLSATHARTLVALVGARAEHPRVMDAFGCGELSIDQTALAIQARPEHDDDIAVWARIMTLPQLRLAVRA